MWASLLVATVLGFAQVQPVDLDLPSAAPAAYLLEGYLDEAPKGTTVQYTVVIGYGKRDRTYLVTKSTVDGEGDPFALFNNLGMFKPDFVLVGPDKPLEDLITAKKGARVTGRFYYRRGMNTLDVETSALKVE